jgi:hypothetical protein
VNAIHALRISTYIVDVDGIRVKVTAFDREEAKWAALAQCGGGNKARIISGPRDRFGGCCDETEPHVHTPVP